MTKVIDWIYLYILKFDRAYWTLDDRYFWTTLTATNPTQAPIPLFSSLIFQVEV